MPVISEWPCPLPLLFPRTPSRSFLLGRVSCQSTQAASRSSGETAFDAVLHSRHQNAVAEDRGGERISPQGYVLPRRLETSPQDRRPQEP